MIRKAAGIAALVFGVVACTSNDSTTSAPLPASASGTASTSAALVSGRAGKPTGITAPGIQIPNSTAQFTVHVGSSNVVVTGGDWNTIVATSKVEPDVGVEFTSGFNWNATTRNRFQYLADRIAKADSSHDFDPLGVATGITNDSVVTIVALYNTSDHTGTLTGLKLTITAAPGKTLVGTGEFFTTADSSVTIPAKTIMFTRLEVPVVTQPKVVNGSREMTDNFHYDRFATA